MAVTRGAFTIFCEGNNTSSLDRRLLNKIFKTESRQPVIVGSEGKFSLGMFAEGYFYPEGREGQQYIIFRDRDFDIQPPEEVRLITDDKSRILTYRTCIENYFLNAELIHNYWQAKYQEKQDNPQSKWSHKNSPGVEEIAQWIESASKGLKDYQAVRWALGNISQSVGEIKLKTTWINKSDRLPQSLTLSDCREEALKLINDFSTTATLVNQAKFQHKLNEYQTRFERDEFWSERKYLTWFNGKNIFKEMQRQRNDYISLDDFLDTDFAIAQLDITQHPDLMELKTKIREISTRSPENTT